MTSGITSPEERYSPLDEDALQDLYTWIDEIPLSRPKRSITRDFSDGVLIAEIVHHFVPKLVEMHNYTPANAQSQKLTNWNTLNRKVLAKIHYTVPENTVKSIIVCKPGTIEQVLNILRVKIDKYIAKRKAQSLRDQDQMQDEFSGPIIDHNTYLYNDGYSTNGPENNYGYAFNTGPVEMRYGGYPAQQQQPEFSSHPGAPPMKPLSGPRQSDINNDEHSKGSNMKLRQRGPNQPVDKGSRTNVATMNKGGKVPRAQSYQDVSSADSPNLRLLLEEKEQSLLASQETVQILQVKIRRLEHLLHLKDIRIDDLTKRLQQATHPPPRQLPPQQNAPQPSHSGDPVMHPAMMNMHHQQPLPPLQHHHFQNPSMSQEE